MKNTKTIVALTALVFLMVILPIGTVFAQNASYTIQKIDHQVEVMYSGHVVIRDTVQVSGQVTDGFLIGFPYKYGAYIQKVLAYDSENEYQVNLGLQLGDRSGFYAASVDFGGKSPQVFTVAFILSNRLVTEQDFGIFTLDFPAYPSLTTEVSSCNVNLVLSNNPTSVTILKEDGEVVGLNYGKANLPAYTYMPAKASVQLPAGAIQLAKISELNRQILITPSGTVSSSDSYHITNNSTIALKSFMMGLPLDASNVVVRDEFGRILTSELVATKGKTLQFNVTLASPLTIGQSATLTADYNLPNAVEETSNFVLKDFIIYPDFNYYVDKATFTFIPPEGAAIKEPQLSDLDSTSSLERDTFQDILTITKTGISHVDYSTQSEEALQFAYSYNPVWSSFRPTFWATFLAVIGSVAVAFLTRRKPTEKEPIETRQRITPKQVPTTPQPLATEPKIAPRITSEVVRKFTDAYEDRKEASSEIKLLDARAQKGKIQRRQYKLQHRALESRIEALSVEIEETKNSFRSSPGVYSDLARQLDLAEEELNDAEENIRTIEAKQSRGEITIDVYKRTLGEYQRKKDKAESAINGIMLRLREKIH